MARILKLDPRVIKVKFANKDGDNYYPDGFEGCTNGDWIDLRASGDYILREGDFALIDLGVAMKIPEGFEGHLLPRSSTFKKWGVIMVNGMGIIDNDYAGNDDIWMMPVYATRDAHITAGSRVAQFRIEKTMRDAYGVQWDEVSDLGDESRGGFGSTGM